MHNKLTESERMNLEDEIFWCKKNLKSLVSQLNTIMKIKNDIISDIHFWKERHAKADRRLAFATKLTKCTGKKREEGVVRSLKGILEDKDKLKAFIRLLEEEGGDLK